MKKIPRRKNELTGDAIVNTIWVSSFLAIILAVPPLAVFLSIYFATGNVLVGAVLGFGIHFVTLAFSDKISRFLVSIMS